MLKLLVLTIVATLCLSQDPGDDEYISCDDCQIPHGEFPLEGQMVCFEVKTGYDTRRDAVYKCKKRKCEPLEFFCLPRQECAWEVIDIPVPVCQLERRMKFKPIEHHDNVYQIYSPEYGISEYPNNTYCAWNVADTGLVSYQIVDQQLQEPLDCNVTGCNCPDSVKISAGSNEVTLCGSNMPIQSMQLSQLSTNGLHVRFCSDNKHTAKGFKLLASRHTIMPLGLNETEIAELEDQEVNNETYSKELTDILCHYKHMMKYSSLPEFTCPDDAAVKTTLLYHNHLMSISSQPQNDDGMCNETTHMMPTMNKIENCAAEYLNRTRDCVFARMLVNSTSTISELRGVARAIVENDVTTRNKEEE